MLSKLLRFERCQEHNARLVHPQVLQLSVPLLNVAADVLQDLNSVHSRHLKIEKHKFDWRYSLNDALGSRVL